MDTHANEITNRFVVLLMETAAELLGPKELSVLMPEVTIRTSVSRLWHGKVESRLDVSDRATLENRIKTLINEFERTLGAELTENWLEDIYTKLEKKYSPSLVNQVILPLIPPNFLEKYRLQYLSKEELEARVLEKTAELRELNTELEQKVAKRTRDLEKLLEEQRKRDLELTKANAELRELDQRKSEFLSIAAHQLRTPLSGLKWALQMLIKGEAGPVSSEQRTLLKKSYEGNERMISLVEQMLHANQIDAGVFALKTMPTPLFDLIESVIYDISPGASEKNVRIVFDRGGVTLPPLMVDQEKIRAVFQNLLDNAVKYSTLGTQILISVSRVGTVVQFAVKDTGIGIPKDQQAQIFSRFFRARNARKVDPNGNGLGLYIAKGIIEMHGGTLGFESTEDRGTTFQLTLPV